ncbi:MAG: PAS domain-containing protein [Alphaproteobacteria bacterium]|nr:PAS domain-containing protein [Alphaproteobacteria bacterium]
MTEALDRLRGEILDPTVRGGVDYWRGLLRGRQFPARADIDPAAIPRQLEHISILDVSGDPPAFRVRLLGQVTRDRQGLAAGNDIGAVGVDQGRDRILTRLRLCVAEARPIRGVYRYTVLGNRARQVWAEAVSCPLSSDGRLIDHVVTFGADFDTHTPSGMMEWP